MQPDSKWIVNMRDGSEPYEVTFVSRRGPFCTVKKEDGIEFEVHRRFLRPVA